MIDRLFSAALAFCVLAGGTAAIGSALFETHSGGRTEARIVELPPVVVVGQRMAAAPQVVELPAVLVVGQRTRQLANAAAEIPATTTVQ